MSSLTMQEIYNKLLPIEENMVTKSQMESFIDTIEILSDHETMHALIKSEDDIKEGRIKRISGVRDLIAELDTS